MSAASSITWKSSMFSTYLRTRRLDSMSVASESNRRRNNALIIFSWLIVNSNTFGAKDHLYKKYPNLEKKFSRNLFNSKSLINNLENDYNVKFLPKTQFTNIDFKKIKINFKPHFKEPKSHTFFLELLENDIWIIDKEANIFKTNLEIANKIYQDEALELEKIQYHEINLMQ